MRAPGMTLMKMPIFTWACTWANILIAASFPILTAVLAMLTLDRYLDFHFFTNELGGNAMMYINLFWAWGHPEVYILILLRLVFSQKLSQRLLVNACLVISRWFTQVVQFQF